MFFSIKGNASNTAGSRTDSCQVDLLINHQLKYLCWAPPVSVLMFALVLPAAVLQSLSRSMMLCSLRFRGWKQSWAASEETCKEWWDVEANVTDSTPYMKPYVMLYTAHNTFILLFFIYIYISNIFSRCPRRSRSSCTLCCTVVMEVKQRFPSRCYPGWHLSTHAPLTSPQPSWPWSAAFWEICPCSCRRANSSSSQLKRLLRPSPTPPGLLGCQRRYYNFCLYTSVWGQQVFFCFYKLILLFSKDTLNWSKVIIKSFMIL